MRYTVSFLLILVTLSLKGHEGMWLPNRISENIKEMQLMGLNMNANQLYSDSVSGLNHAIVKFGSGCTGSIISPNGLIITNYHCAHKTIQALSSMENNLLMDGFWSKGMKEEIPCPGLTIGIVTSMHDISDAVYKGVSDTLTKTERSKLKRTNSDSIRKTFILEKGEKTLVKSLDGQQIYYLYIIKEFTDIRFVAAPPHSVGKFGGDTDNWRWPRHGADFAMFRIYADSLNNPAKYSKNNHPYQAPRFLPISIEGIQKNDFTMVYGFPGTTTENLPSANINYQVYESNPHRIGIRDIKLDIIKSHMQRNAEIKTQYSAKAASISNSWKKWKGIQFGIKETHALDHKKELEQKITRFFLNDSLKYNEVENLFEQYNATLKAWKESHKAYNFYLETFHYKPEILSICKDLEHLVNLKEKKINQFDHGDKTKRLDKKFKNFNPIVEKELFVSLTTNYMVNLDKKYVPKTLLKFKEKNNRNQLLAELFDQSVYGDQSKLYNLLSDTGKTTFRKLSRDEIFSLSKEIDRIYFDVISPEYYRYKVKIDSMNQVFLKLKQEAGFGTGYPDANSTLRIAYGKVDGYEPRDGVYYQHYTTNKGIVDKYNQNIPDYESPSKLISKLKGDIGKPYGNNNGKLNICFTASNHTTGGNSGSPVLNANGDLIGLNFDRTWESTMSDLHYDSNICRNVTLDIRYVLFLIDEYSGAKNIVRELFIKK